MPIQPKPLVLIILDGWGYRDDPNDNAISQANTPVWDKLMLDAPHMLLNASGHYVGLPGEQMGNSEVGHMNMGAGRVVHQELTRIDQAIEDRRFFQNKVLLAQMQALKAQDKALHILGLLSPGGVHSHERHTIAMLEMAAQCGLSKVYLHVFLDGRDTAPKSATASIKKLEARCRSLHCGRIVSMVGRYYAMDRNSNWDRIQIAFDLLTQGKASYQAKTPEAGLIDAYERGETDEFVGATAIIPDSGMPIQLQPGDGLLFMNFRADRARQLTRALTEPAFSEFTRAIDVTQHSCVTLTQYSDTIQAQVAFLPVRLADGLGEVLAKHHISQLRLAETEKYAHVTFFFNGGREQPFIGESRELIPSKDVATYDTLPQMSAPEVTAALVNAIKSGQQQAIICNYANADMVGHTGNFAATVQAIECLDHSLGEVLAALSAVGGEALITADHGNAEMMYNTTSQQVHTAHTNLPIPFVYVGERAMQITHPTGQLSDIAPTFLYLMGLPIPSIMTGHTLLTSSR